MKRIMTSLFTLVLFSALAVSVANAQRAHLGFRGGYNFDREDALLGAQLSLPVGGMVEVYPSFDYYFTDGGGSLLGINMDLKLRSMGGSHSAFYVGGGLSLMRASAGGASTTDTGGSLFAGLESRVGSAHPFFEVRGLLHDQSSVQIVGGLNFTLY
jgi:hypothetical protein